MLPIFSTFKLFSSSLWLVTCFTAGHGGSSSSSFAPPLLHPNQEENGHISLDVEQKHEAHATAPHLVMDGDGTSSVLEKTSEA